MEKTWLDMNWGLYCVGHGGSPTTEVRRVLFDVSFNVYHHSLGTPVGGQFSYVY
jgi:hypothetical protein